MEGSFLSKSQSTNILESIFQFFPFPYINNFKRVCKLWKSLIETIKFTKIRARGTKYSSQLTDKIIEQLAERDQLSRIVVADLANTPLTDQGLETLVNCCK